jgi:hypothetical protein
VTTLKIYSTFIERGFEVLRWRRYSLMVAEVLSSPCEGLSPPFLSLFVLTFDVGVHGVGSGDIFRLYLVRIV